MFLTKTRLLEQENNVPTKEGLIVELDVALLYVLSTLLYTILSIAPHPPPPLALFFSLLILISRFNLI